MTLNSSAEGAASDRELEGTEFRASGDERADAYRNDPGYAANLHLLAI